MSESITFSSAEDEPLPIPGEHLIQVSRRKISSCVWVRERDIFRSMYQHQLRSARCFTVAARLEVTVFVVTSVVCRFSIVTTACVYIQVHVNNGPYLP